MPANTYLKEVERFVNAAPASERANNIVFLKKYIGTHYDFLGIKVPAQRVIYKKGYSFSALKLEKQIEVWNSIWQQSNCHDVMTQAIFFWERNLTKVDALVAWKHLKKWVSRVDNWAHSDGLSGLYSYLLEAQQAVVLPEFKTWSKSNNPWKRRQSVVGLIHYHSKREKLLPYKTLIPFVENLLDDKDYFVQKGIGWALREIGQVYPKETFTFLKKHYAHITGTAFAAASEKLSIEEKEELKQLRKDARRRISL